MANSSISAQQTRLLDALEIMGTEGLTTIQAREELDIMMPAARVHELRHLFSKNIVTVWKWDTNAQGNEHRTARYVLVPGKWKGAAQ